MKNRLKIMEGTGDYMNKNQNIRFNMDKESDIMAWESIHSKDVGERFKSQNRFVIEAINYYYERVMRIQEDPYLETNKGKRRCICGQDSWKGRKGSTFQSSCLTGIICKERL